MILPIALKLSQNRNKLPLVNKKQNSARTFDNSMQLSNINSPIKSYISFGWCDAHYQAMYEIDKEQIKKINKLYQIEELKEQKHERYSIYDMASTQAAKIISQYSNLMFTVAEVPPSFALQNAKKFKAAIDKSKTLSNPLNVLTAINAIAKMEVKNEDLTPIRKERAKGATQLYSIAILLDKIEENKDKPEFQHILAQINSLSDTIKETLRHIYGDDIFEKIKYFGSLGKYPSDADKKAALDFIIEVDSNAQSLKLPHDFEKNLIALLNEQSDFEGRTRENSLISQKALYVKLNYPDHDHNPVYTNTHEHSHNIPERRKIKEENILKQYN